MATVVKISYLSDLLLVIILKLGQAAAVVVVVVDGRREMRDEGSPR